MSLKPVATRLSELMKKPIAMAPDCVGPAGRSYAAETGAEILLLENLRYHAEEEKNDPEFSRQLAFAFAIYMSMMLSGLRIAHQRVYRRHDSVCAAGRLPGC